MLTGCLARKLHSRTTGSTRSLENIESIAAGLSWLPCEGGQIAPDPYRDHRCIQAPGSRQDTAMSSWVSNDSIHFHGPDTCVSSQVITRGTSLAPIGRVNIHFQSMGLQQKEYAICNPFQLVIMP